jgi:phosphate acetyltransferase
MLSFFTKGSARHEKVDKVLQALSIVKERRPGLLIDGEFQMDAALEPEVARLKCPQSEVAGKANVLIYPDLNSSNIDVKTMERLGGADMLGPILQGLSGAMNDLSRGCKTKDIVKVIAVTAVQHARLKEKHSSDI